MKFPITVTYRQLEAKIYRSQIDGVKYYKAAYRAKGGRVTKTFRKLKEAREAATKGLKEAHQRGDGLASLSTKEATKLLAALDLLKDTGHSDPLKVVAEYIVAKSILSGGSIIDASQDFLRRRKTIAPNPNEEVDDDLYEHYLDCRWCTNDSATAQAFHYLSRLDLGPSKPSDEDPLGSLELVQGPHPGSNATYAIAECEQTLSCLQHRLLELGEEV